MDGSEGAETVRLSLGDEGVDIDLAQANRDKLRKLLAPYFHRGREVKRPGGGETAKVREWLKSNGHKVPEKGRIPADLQAIYDQAHPEQ